MVLRRPTRPLQEVADLVPKAYKVNLGSPERAIFVQIIKNVCCLAVSDMYHEYSKFNIRVLLGQTDQPSKKAAAAPAKEESSGDDDAPSEDEGEGDVGEADV